MSDQRVVLKCYDLSRGYATMLGPILGLNVEGVWHTGIYVYGSEFFYGGGIQCGTPELVVQEYGLTAKKEIDLGPCSKTLDQIHQWCYENTHRFTDETYDLLKWNCNHFTNELAKFCLDRPPEQLGIPLEILNQHEVIARLPMGARIIQMIEGFEKEAKKFQAGEGIGRFIATGRPVNAPSPPPIPRWSANPNDFESRIRALWDDTAVRTTRKEACVNLLRQLGENILDHVTDEKYRQVRANHKHVRDDILEVPHGPACLQALGFMPAVAESGEQVYRVTASINREFLVELRRNVTLMQNLLSPNNHEESPPPPSNPNHPPNNNQGSAELRQKYTKEIETLQEIGFQDVDKCVMALKATNGNVELAVDLLLR